MKHRIPLKAALLMFVEKRIRAYCRKNEIAVPDSPTEFWSGICQVICAIPDVPERTKQKARKWLKEHDTRRDSH
ncbi:MAG: hypothetical protein K1W18_01775 [Oscillospiraceae bacterium]